MSGEKPVTPGQAAHENHLRLHRNGAMNLAARIPEFLGKVLGPWLVPAPQDGPAMRRHAETPGITADERRSIEPWNFSRAEPAIADRPPVLHPEPFAPSAPPAPAARVHDPEAEIEL